MSFTTPCILSKARVRCVQFSRGDVTDASGPTFFMIICAYAVNRQTDEHSTIYESCHLKGYSLILVLWGNRFNFHFESVSKENFGSVGGSLLTGVKFNIIYYLKLYRL